MGGDLGLDVDVSASASASGWGVCRLSCTAMWILFPFPPLNSVPSMEHANACHWGSSHAPGFQPRPAAKLTSQPSALCDMTLAKDQGLRTRHWSQAPGIEIGIGTARSTKDQGPGVGVCLARSEAFREVRLCMPSLDVVRLPRPCCCKLAARQWTAIMSCDKIWRKEAEG